MQPLTRISIRRELRVVLVERFRMGTDYHDLVARLSRLCHHPHLVGHIQLIIEKNGPGQVVDEMIKRAKLPVSYLPVTTTGGNQVSVRGSDRFVPKEKLIGALEYLFQQNLLKVSSQVPQSDLLREEAGPDGVHFDVTEGGGPMVVVEDAGEETTLPEMTAKFLGGVAVGGVLAVDVHHEQGDGVRAITGVDEVEVIRQEGVSGDVYAAFLAMRFEEAEEVFAIRVA